MKLHTAAIILLIIFSSCNSSIKEDAGSRIVEILNTEAGKRELKIKNLIIIDSTVVSNHIKDLDIIRFYRELKQNTNKQIELEERNIELIGYQLEKYEFGFLTIEELEEKENWENRMAKHKKSITESKADVERIKNRITTRMLNSSNYDYDSLLMINYFLDCTIENVELSDTVKVYFSKDYKDYLSLKNIFYGIEKVNDPSN